ncbi:hypothetical protein [Marinactinospora thermotolerans]|nr:hypothetical protein [Marinactinospora thermotolerans]
MRRQQSWMVVSAVSVLLGVTGCVKDEGPNPSEEERASTAASPSAGATPGAGGAPQAVEGDPDTPMPVPGSSPEAPADLVDAIEQAALTRVTTRFEATATLNGIPRARASGGYAFHEKDRVDFTADLEMSSREGDDYSARSVAVGEDFYLRPPSTEGMPEGTSWVLRSREDFEDPPEPRALYAETIRAISGIRDWSMIAAASDLVPAGARTVDGVRGSGHHATFDVLDGMANVSGKGGAWRVLQDLHAQGVEEISFTVWVDDEYLPLAVLVHMDTEEGPGHVDLTFTDWGTTIEFPLPPRAEVWQRS